MAVINKDFVVNNGLQITEYITKVGGTAPLNGQLLIGDATNSRFSVGSIQITNGATVSQGAGTITIGTNATNNNTASTIVSRDASGNFTAGNITATNFIGSGAQLTGLTSSQITSALGYTPSNSTSAITITGDATGSGTNSIALTLASSGVTAGTYSAVTVNAKGIVTSGGAIGSAVVTTALGYTPVNPTALSSYAPLASPAFTGTPTAITASPGTNTTQLATTAFVTAAVSAASSGVVSFNTRTGAITLQSSDVTAALGYTPANIASPAFTGTPTAPTPAQFNNSTDVATTAFVQTALGNFQNGISLSSATTLTASALGTIYSLNSTTAYTVTLPAISTVSLEGGTFWFYCTNNAGVKIQAAGTDQFITGPGTITAGGSITMNTGDTASVSVIAGSWQLVGGSIAQTLSNASTKYAPLASPALTGTPTAPTATTGTNTTQLATTAFVQSSLGNYQSRQLITGATTFTNASSGSWIELYGTGPYTVTLPAPTVANLTFTFTNVTTNATVITLSTPSANIYNQAQAATTLNIPVGATVSISSDASNWTVLNFYSPSPNFVGTPTAPTASVGTNTTQLATTAFVTSAMNTGVQSLGKVNGVNNPNLVFNGSAELGNSGWTLSSFTAVSDLTGGYGTYFGNTAALSSFSGNELSPQISVTTATPVTASVDILNQATAGTVTLVLAAYNSSGTFISDFATLVITNGTTSTRYNLSGTTPANTAYIECGLTLSGVTAAAYGVTIRRMKIEIGTTPSLYSTEATLRAIGGMSGATIYTNTGTTLTLAQSGNIIELDGTTAETFTLPAPTIAGTSYVLWNNSTAILTLSTPSGDFYGPAVGSAAGTTSKNVEAGAAVRVVADGFNWIVTYGFEGVTAPQFDNTTKLATTSFVQRSLGNHQTSVELAGTYTSTAVDAGKHFVWDGNGTFTLPVSTSVPSGTRISVFKYNTSDSATFATQGSDTFNWNGVSGTSVSIGTVTGFIQFVTESGAIWDAVGGDLQLIHSYVMSGANFTTQPQFTNNTTLATTAFVKAAGLQFTSNAGLAFSASTTLTLAQLNGWGQFQSSGLTVTLPSLATVEKGATFTFLGSNYGGTLAGNSTDQIQNSLSAVANTLAIGIGESITLVSNTSYWYVVMDGVNSSTVAGNYAPLASPAFTGTPTAPTATAGTSTTQLATTAFATSAINTAVAAAKYYDVTGGASGAITASQVMTLYVSARTLNFPANFAGSQGYAVTAPTASVTFTVAVNGSTVGTIVFAASSHTSTFTTSSGAFTVTPGQYMTVTAPATADATLATVAFTLLSLAS
jgi:hypothetical protein